jgi:Signal recognition particle GTPase
LGHDFFKNSRITVFAGHYGSGKTTLAVNCALSLKPHVKNVALCDLDIVNPYFRTTDAADVLSASGVDLIASEFANTNVDAPALPASTMRIFDEPGLYSVIDLGGDDRGALALGRYADLIQNKQGYEMLLVVNKYRPLTRSLPDLLAIKEEIEAAAKVRFTGIANNSNLGAETKADDIAASLDFADEAALALGLPLKMTSLDRALLEGVDAEELQNIGKNTPLFPMTIYKKTTWKL